MKLTREKKNKPLFWEWVMFDPKAFKVLFGMSIITGLLISIVTFILSIVFDWYGEIKFILLIVMVSSIYNFIKNYKMLKYTDYSLNEFVYNGKYKQKVNKNGNDRQSNRRSKDSNKKRRTINTKVRLGTNGSKRRDDREVKLDNDNATENMRPFENYTEGSSGGIK
jgi:hypothetical protein